MPTQTWAELASTLADELHLATPPLAITFTDAPPAGVQPYADPTEPMPAPLDDGRTGRVAAGCVFWIKATDRTFSTVADDHGNCSVGSMTHGFKTLDEVAGNSDVAALFETGWVTMDVVPQIPVVRERPGAITYGPLADTPVDPDVVFLRVNGRQLMVLSDAIPGLRIEGKPQCHIVAIAKDEGVAAASVGCALSRVRTGMQPAEMTCALPAAQLGEIVASVQRNAAADSAVAKYAAADATRF
jgi:uncharacterized protein (DUF169 family)